MNLIIGLIAALYLLTPLPLLDGNAAYYVTVVVCFVAIGAAMSYRRLHLSILDVGWSFSLMAAVVYLVASILNSGDLAVIAAQSLIFLMPVISLASRNWKLDNSKELITKACLALCALKIFSYVPYVENYLTAISSIGVRGRFHDYSSIIVVIISVAALLSNSIVGRWKTLFVGITASALLLGIAHRSLYVALACQLAYALSFLSRKIVVRSCLAVIAGFIILISTPAGKVMARLFEASLSRGDANTEARINLSAAVVKSSLEYPFGHGFGKLFEFGTDARGDFVYYALQHNSFLTYLYFLGMLPFIVILCMFAYLLFSPAPRTPLGITLKSSLIGMLVFAYFNLFLEHPVFGFFFWLVFGIYLAEVKRAGKRLSY